MEVKADYAWNSIHTSRKNSPLLPSNIRALIIGKSNCGKTTLLMNFLLEPNWLDYTHLYVFGRSLHQLEYQIIKKGFQSKLSKQQVGNIFRNKTEIDDPLKLIDDYALCRGKVNGVIKAEFYEDCAELPDPKMLNVHDKNLLILDDCLLEKQNKAEAYYTRGRHNNCDTFYISQSYFKLPRQTIRENANFIILFPQDSKNIMHIYADHCSVDMDYDEFKTFCKKGWEGKHNFITIDVTSSKENGKYRKNLNTFYFPTSV